jgi:hypothetical protein
LGRVWLGRACAKANEEELTKVPKTWGSLGKKRGGRNKKGGPVEGGVATVGRVAVAR